MPGLTWTVLQDPEGNEFCVGSPHAADDNSVATRRRVLTSLLAVGSSAPVGSPADEREVPCDQTVAWTWHARVRPPR